MKHSWNGLLHRTPTRLGILTLLVSAPFLLAAGAQSTDYMRARIHPIHFKPAIDTATDEQCLSCHQEILTYEPRSETSSGVKASDTLAWYQTLDTYAGDQKSFHWRHLQSPFAGKVMKLQCTFCHQGNDPREEAQGASATTRNDTTFNLRKMVNTSQTCLRCHGAFPSENMQLDGPWHELRADLEDEETPNGCLTCHQDQFRTVRHQVSYLNAEVIEELAKQSSDACYGCHGGRSWYRISYPYPRHAWPDMPEETPEWAVERPTQSEAKYHKPSQ